MVPRKTAEKTEVPEDKKLQNYELVLIINPDVAEEQFTVITDGVSQFITTRDGNITEVEQWGKKKLAYPIKRFLDGNYVRILFGLDPALTKELDANLQISEDVLRHLLIKLDD